MYVMDAYGADLINLTQNPANDAGWPSWWSGKIPDLEAGDTPQNKTVQAGLSALVTAKRNKGPRSGTGGNAGDGPEKDPRCVEGQADDENSAWITAAPTNVVVIGDSAQIGLRNSAGQSGNVYPISAIVVAPDGSQAQARSFLEADEWTALVYPEDFSAIDPADTEFVTDEGVAQQRRIYDHLGESGRSNWL